GGATGAAAAYRETSRDDGPRVRGGHSLAVSRRGDRAGGGAGRAAEGARGRGAAVGGRRGGGVHHVRHALAFVRSQRGSLHAPLSFPEGIAIRVGESRS